MATHNRRSIFHQSPHHNNNRTYSHILLIANKSGASLYSFSLDSLNFVNCPQMIDATTVKNLVPPPPTHTHKYSRPSRPDYAYCNGLIHIFNSRIYMVWAIWNPLTKEFRKLPRPKLDDTCLYGFGLGYDYEADDYKAVVVCGWETFIYSLKSASWRKVEDCPDRVDEKGVFWNGSLYWLCYNRIIALDLGTEIYSLLPLPNESINYKSTSVRLESLDGCLFCCLDHRCRQLFEGWVMKDNGVEKSWIKLFSLQHFVTRAPERSLRLVAYLKSKDQVVLQHDLGFAWFDLRNNSVKKLSIHGLPDVAFSQIYSGSLVRLNNHDTTDVGVGAVTAGRTRKRKIEIIDTSLKFCVRDAGERCCSDTHFCGEDSCRHWKEE